ncbi:hypothetical protein SDC9_155532 [bioreactor metagenome]|uniref:Uncharacterized protein n=1 Tax=bioreactor metagenome TaxID=1076179 RepID=A0A645F351_9ZZZZ
MRGVFGRRGASSRQISDFIRNDGKALPRNTGPLRFNGRIQCQYVRLKCNFFNCFNDFPNVFRGLVDESHCRNHPVHLLIAGFHLGLHMMDARIYISRIVRVLLCSNRYFLDGCRKICHRAGLLLRSLRQMLGNLHNLP